jgi:hypothetical protein
MIHAYIPPMQEAQIGESYFSTAWDPIKKITKAKGVGSMAHKVECLHNKHKTLNSNPNTPPKNKKKNPKQKPC